MQLHAACSCQEAHGALLPYVPCAAGSMHGGTVLVLGSGRWVCALCVWLRRCGGGLHAPGGATVGGGVVAVAMPVGIHTLMPYMLVHLPPWAWLKHAAPLALPLHGFTYAPVLAARHTPA